MNFRVCKKRCKMTRLSCVTFMDSCGTTPYVRFQIEDEKENSCCFCIESKSFSQCMARDIEKAVDSRKVRREDGHDGDPAFSTRRHVDILNSIDMKRLGRIFRKNINEYSFNYKCPFVEEHKDVKKIFRKRKIEASCRFDHSGKKLA